MLELSLACSLVGSTAWTVLASSSSDTMEVEPQDWIPESCGAIPGAYQEAQKKGVAARRCSMPRLHLQKRAASYYWVRREDLEGSGVSWV